MKTLALTSKDQLTSDLVRLSAVTEKALTDAGIEVNAATKLAYRAGLKSNLEVPSIENTLYISMRPEKDSYIVRVPYSGNLVYIGSYKELAHAKIASSAAFKAFSTVPADQYDFGNLDEDDDLLSINWDDFSAESVSSTRSKSQSRRLTNQGAAA